MGKKWKDNEKKAVRVEGERDQKGGASFERGSSNPGCTEALLNSCRCTGQRGPVCANLPPEHILERRGFEDDPGAAGL